MLFFQASRLPAGLACACVVALVETGPPTHGVSVGAARTHDAPTQAVGP
jgi:hypothetical protein